MVDPMASSGVLILQLYSIYGQLSLKIPFQVPLLHYPVSIQIRSQRLDYLLPPTLSFLNLTLYLEQ